MRHRRNLFILSTALALALLVGSVGGFAQGVQTGQIRGRVTTEDGEGIPGVLVTADSTVSQGHRVVVSGENGEFILRALAPGLYSLTLELEGLTTVQTAATVELGQATPVEVAMSLAAQEETIVVSGELPSVLASSEVSTTYGFEEVNNLPVGRTPQQIATLAPGLSVNTPNAGQLTISGGFAYDNVFLIDGVDANDNLFGTTNPVFIEDAIADLQVLTSGISAEYGRFSGGVVNVITKSGGNEFSGTLRADITNPAWTDETPLESRDGIKREDKVNEVYQGTLGGYVLKDKLWFFAAARDSETSAPGVFPISNLPQPTDTSEDRQEIKLTGNIANRHQVQAQATDRDQSQLRPSFGFSATPDTLRNREDPNELRVLRYSGMLSPTLFLEAQASEKEFGFRYTHAFDDLRDSPFLNFGDGPFIHYNAPYFDGTDPEDRNNEQLAASLSYFFDGSKAGSHDLKIGSEDFTSTLVGGNSQSSTDFVFGAQPLFDAQGNLVLDAGNKAIPLWFQDSTLLIQFLPTRGAEVDINTLSLYANDRWRLNDHWSFNLGVRYEQVDSEATGNITTIDTDRVVPRLSASYDLLGNGKYRFDATYAQYSGKYSESQFAANTAVGNPLQLVYVYTGPDGQGLGFDPAFDLNNYALIDASVPTANVVVTPDIQSPVVDELTLQFGYELPKGGFVKAVYTDREYSDFVEDFILSDEAACQALGASCSTDVFLPENLGGDFVGRFNNTFVTNSDLPERSYQAVQLLGRYRLLDNLEINGNYTLQLANEGNFEGENTNQPGISSTLGNFPGVFFANRHFPTGDLNDYQEHRVNLWANYNQGLGRAGNLNLGLLYRFNSGTTFSFADVLRLPFSQLQAEALGNFDSSPNSTQTVFFGDRGAGRFGDWYTFDLSVNYTVPVFADLELWVKADVFNLFNNQKQIAWNTNITADAGGPLDENGLPTQFELAPDFGNPVNNASYVAPRAYQMTVGFRF